MPTRTNSIVRPAGLVLVLCLHALAAAAQPIEPIRYVVSFPKPETNSVEVEATVPTGGAARIDLMMAVWTPGSYLVREYERHVEALTARGADGAPLGVMKPVKNRWRIDTGGRPRVIVSYRVYAHEMTVRSNWVEADFAMLNGAPTFLTLPDRVARPHDVQLRLPPAWKTTMTGLPEASDGAPHHYLAPDFDTLVDSPIIAGNPAVHTFDVDGKRHHLVNVGEAGVWDGARSVADVERIVREARRFWGALPYDHYVFLNVLTGAGGGLNQSGGGLEHRNSVLMMASRWDTGTREQYLGWLSLVSHEYFHAWNVKRLRPVELGPFEYEREVYTKSLWIAEGVTDYYADLLLHRAGLSTDDEYLTQLSNAIRALQTTPGRLVQPVESASFDAWIKQYRPDENTSNTSISYYTKGAVVGFVLDAHIRRATGNAKSLDDVMRAAFAKYSGERGFAPEEFRAVASEIAGRNLSAWFTRALETVEELDYSDALDWYGLRFRAPEQEEDPPGWIGAVTRDDSGRLVVVEVPRGTPAFDAGVNVQDELLAIDDFRVRAGDLDRRLESYRPGRQVALLIARRDELKRLALRLGSKPDDRWRLETLPDATESQAAHRLGWWTNAGAGSRGRPDEARDSNPR